MQNDIQNVTKTETKSRESLFIVKNVIVDPEKEKLNISIKLIYK